MTSQNTTVLVLYDAHGPQIGPVAEAIANGARRARGVDVSVKHIDAASREDLLNCDALAIGSPNWSGISSSMKTWLDNQGDLWEEGQLNEKVGAAFATGRGRHSGLEFTLLSLIHWMLACGIIIVGLPWNDRMRTSGSYYGATVAGSVTQDDLEQGRILGQRLAETAVRLKAL